MTEQTAQEPTMEEILASIRRIISEDDAPADAGAAPAAEVAHAPEPAPEPEPVHVAAPEPVHEDEEVLELTDRYEEQAPAAPMPVMESIGDIDAFETPRAAPEPRPEPRPEPKPEPRYEAPLRSAFADEPAHDDALIGSHVADHAASAFDMFSQSLQMPASGRSLEDLVKELMKPMLREWLDKNLTGIVEAQVRLVAEDVARRRGR
jgi:cell pole-organizing protein PopZ